MWNTTYSNITMANYFFNYYNTKQFFILRYRYVVFFFQDDQQSITKTCWKQYIVWNWDVTCWLSVAITWNLVIRKKKTAEWYLCLSSSSESAGSQTLEHTHTLSHTLAHTHFSKLMSPRYPVCKSLLLFLFLHHNTRSKTPPPSNPSSILLKSDSEPTGAGPPHVDPSDEVKSSITFSALASWKKKSCTVWELNGFKWERCSFETLHMCDVKVLHFL